MGQLHYIECLTVFSGIVGLIRTKPQFGPILWLWLLLYPIPAALTSQTHAIRAIVGAPLFAILSGYGVHTVWEAIQPWRRSHLAAWSGAIVLAASVLLYCKFYFIDYPQTTWRWWQYGIREAIQYVEQRELPCIIAGPKGVFDPAYVFVLFYTRFPPDIYHTLPENQHNHNWVKTGEPLGKYYITGQVEAIVEKGPGFLLVGPQLYQSFAKKGFEWHMAHTVQTPAGNVLTGVLYTTGQKMKP